MTDQTPITPSPDERDELQHETDETLERLTAQYTEEYRAGLAPRPDEYIKRFPQYTRELAEFFLYFHTITVDLPDPDPVPTSTQLAPAAVAALARFRQRHPAQPAAQPAIASLAKRGQEVGLTPPALAQQVDVSFDFFARLEARAIKAAEIPRTLIRQLAAALQVAPEAVAYFLSGGASQAGQPASVFFYADSAPKTKQDSFLDAVRASGMTPGQKAEWERIAREEDQEGIGG
jgi:hypothetical protein